jgi:putative Holliday junction resolvase
VRALALDVGDRRIGVALSDPTGLIATPLTTIIRRSEAEDIAAVLALAADNEAGEIVVGMPLLLSGRAGPQARRVSHLARALARQAPVPVETIDERYSTVEAERRLREAGGRPSRDRAKVDAAAAAVILQAHLDARRASSG